MPVFDDRHEKLDSEIGLLAVGSGLALEKEHHHDVEEDDDDTDSAEGTADRRVRLPSERKGSNGIWFRVLGPSALLDWRSGFTYSASADRWRSAGRRSAWRWLVQFLRNG
jgi:hypothetical protein